MRVAGWWVLGVVLVWPASGWCQSAEATRAAARQLANQGVADYQAGNYQGASEKLQRAFSTVKAPSLGLWSARALVKVGRLVQASERYLEVTRLDAKQGDEQVQRQAQADAVREHDELEGRIPTLKIELVGATRAEPLQITLDGLAILDGLLSEPLPADPGKHRIEAKQGAASASATVMLVEGKRETVRLLLRGPDVAPTAAAASATPTELPSTAGLDGAMPPADRGEEGGAHTLTWIGLGLAGAGIGVGTVTGLMAKSQRDELSPRCPNDLCNVKDDAGVKRLSTLRLVSTLGFVVGGVAAAGATIAWFTQSPPPKQAYVQPVLGIASVGLQGAF